MRKTHLVLNGMLAFLAIYCTGAAGATLECGGWQQAHSDWIWCDDFEDDGALESNYFNVDRADGHFGVTHETALSGQGALKATYVPGSENGGGVKLSFGRTPLPAQLLKGQDLSEIYWRVYVKVAPGWVGNAMKTSRASVFASSGWTQAAAGMVWEDNATTGLSLGIDPVSGVSGSTVITTKYNDQLAFNWLGHRSAQTQIYASENADKWFCVEAQMKLNTPGQSDGVFSLWIDDKLEAQDTGLNWRGSYHDYGINALFLENWINGGPTKIQARYMDNLVVSKSKIGCSPTSTVRPNAPANLKSR